MRKPIAVKHARIERDWPGSTVVCLGSGPSLTQADVDMVKGRARVIAVNDTYKLAPWADVLFAADAKWWGWHKGVAGFSGEKYAMIRAARRWPNVQILRQSGEVGLETADPTALRTGKNSGYMAVNVAVHKGASRILLLGYDMGGGRQHFFGEHPDKSRPPFRVCLRNFATLVKPLEELGIEIINCTRSTALKCFPQMSLEEALERKAEAAA